MLTFSRFPEAVFEGDLRLGPEAFEQLDGVLEPGDAVLVVEPEGRVSLFVVTYSNSQHKTSA